MSSRSKTDRNQEILALLKQGKTRKEISKMFGISRQRIYKIVTDTTEGEVDDKPKIKTI